ncbi:hypothetical protein IT411_01040 [Candidatus Peregrinibacteria bacterium]|nr:hypothetical protein [Candidatus Peregrinibacteria bacterium]
MSQVPSIVLKLSAQASLVHVAQAQYDQSVAEFKKIRPELSMPNELSSLRHQIDQQRTALSQAKETWEKLCEELLQAAGHHPQPIDTGNPHLNHMVKFAPTLLEAQRLCKEASDEYLASRKLNHPDQDKLVESRNKLDPAQALANSERQNWGKLCQELLQSMSATASVASSSSN